MIGIDSFKQYFQGFENQYVIIGGTACELLMNDKELHFRATKDIDMVLIIEALSKEFVEVLWKYIKDAGYKHINKITNNYEFYRFYDPKSSKYPTMIELFSKKQYSLPSDYPSNITAIYIDDDISSLSAILLDDNYYNFLKSGILIYDGLPILKVEYIIPFKAKAYLDLRQRKDEGEKVDTKNIKKHKYDVLRLSLLLTPTTKIIAPTPIKNDLLLFLYTLKNEDINFKQLGIRELDKTSFMKLLCDVYDLY